MTKRGLDQVNGRPAVEGMGGVGMPEPVGRDGKVDAGAPRGLAGSRPSQHLAQQGKRTIFNLLGPLVNPARPNIQIIGVYDAKITEAEYRREYQVVQRELEKGKGEPSRQFYYMSNMNRYRVSPVRVPVIASPPPG